MKSISLLLIGIIFIIIFTTIFSSGCGSTASEVKNDSAKSVETKDTAHGTLAVSASPYAKGEEVFNSTCKACHQSNGEGVTGAFPPLAKSDYLIADKQRTIRQVIKGSSAEIIVNGNKFNGVMPPQNLSDDQIADVLNYVLHSWGNNGETVKPEEVKSAR